VPKHPAASAHGASAAVTVASGSFEAGDGHHVAESRRCRLRRVRRLRVDRGITAQVSRVSHKPTGGGKIAHGFRLLVRMSVIVLAGAAGIALVSALAAPAASHANRLTVRTGPGLKIKLTRAGREVDYLRRGRHTIMIRDTSRSHNVALTKWDRYPRGSRRVLSSLAFVGTKAVTATLTPGLWTVSCLHHSSPSPYAGDVDDGMVDSFQVE
jgi:hypothetical protein